MGRRLCIHQPSRWRCRRILAEWLDPTRLGDPGVPCERDQGTPRRNSYGAQSRKSAQRRKTIRVSTRHVSLDVPRVRPRRGPRLPQAVTATYATPRALASPAFLADKVRSPPRTRERRLRASLSPPRVRPPISGLGSRATKSASRHFILNRRRSPPSPPLPSADRTPSPTPAFQIPR